MNTRLNAYGLTKYLNSTHRTHSSVTDPVSRKNPRIQPKTIHPRRVRGSVVTTFQPWSSGQGLTFVWGLPSLQNRTPVTSPPTNSISSRAKPNCTTYRRNPA